MIIAAWGNALLPDRYVNRAFSAVHRIQICPNPLIYDVNGYVLFRLEAVLKMSRAPPEQGARQRDKIVRNDFEQLQADPKKGEPHGWGE